MVIEICEILPMGFFDLFNIIFLSRGQNWLEDYLFHGLKPVILALIRCIFLIISVRFWLANERRISKF